MSSVDTSLPRETGSEKAGTCPVCGNDTPAVTTSYGSTVQGACPDCVAKGEDQLEAQKAAAQVEAPRPGQHAVSNPAGGVAHVDTLGEDDDEA